MRTSALVQRHGGNASRRSPIVWVAFAGVILSFAWAAADSHAFRRAAPPALPAINPRIKHDRRLPVRAMALCCIAVTFAAMYWFSFPRDIGQTPQFNSPRESVGYHLTEQFVGGDGFSVPLRHYDALPHDIAIALTPRDAANLDGDVVPKDFAGTMLTYAAVMRVHPSLALLVSPLFALLGAWVLMRIADELVGKTAGILTFCLWLAFPPFWINASFIFMGDLPALAFFVLAALMFTRYWRGPTLRLAVLMSACFFASVLFRYPNVLLAAPFVAALLIGRRVVIPHVAAAMATGLPFVAVVLLFNQLVYGHPLTTGFHLGAELIAETVHYSQESFFKQRPDVIVQYALTYGAQPAVAAPAALALAATICALVSRRDGLRVFAALTLATVAILIVYYGQQDAWGYKSPQVSASVLRYLLPGFALGTVFAAWACVSAARSWGWPAYAVPIALIIAGGWYAKTAPGGIDQSHAVIERSTVLERQIVGATETDAVIAVRIMDKVLFPERQTLTLTYAIQNEQPFPKGDRETWDYVPTPERFADVALTMNGAGIPVYLLPDELMGGLRPYQEALQERGYYLRRIWSVDAAPFFKVSLDRSNTR